MTFLLEHLPPRTHIVIAGRADPALPLARLRARGELVEVRAADLRFTPDEVAAYLNDVMALRLAADDVVALEGRTEGWIAALQLAALSMEGRDDATDFIAGFAGDDRYVVDYLVEEVVQRQPEDVRSFLLQTSVLDRLNAPLCEAVTGQAGGAAMLARLDRDNLFLVPLDDRRRWYRYHHLFADMLSTRLLDERPDQVPDLHRRASVWHEQHDAPDVAIRHALAARDFARAADLVELTMPSKRRDRQEATLRGWLELLPEDVVRVRPVLEVGYVGALLSTGELEGVDQRLHNVERWLAETAEQPPGEVPPATEMLVVDPEQFRVLPGWVAAYRAAQALLLGDTTATTAHARRALELLEDDPVGHGAAAALTGLASWARGDLEAAHAAYTDCTASMHRAGHLSDVLGCSITLGDIRIAQGRLRDAMRTYESALAVVPADGPPLRGTADMYVGMSTLRYEWDDLDGARALLLRSQALGEHLGLPQNAYRWRVAMARVRQAEGDPLAAIGLLDEAERVYVGDFSPNARPVPAVRARTWIAHGRVQEALAWATGEGLSPDDELSYLREYEHVTLARALLAQSRQEPADRTVSEAAGFVDRLLREAEAGHRTGIVIELLVLQSLTHRLGGNLEAGLVPLERALTLAEPEGYVRTFVDEGPAIGALLRLAARRGVMVGYVGRLLAALGERREASPTRPGLVDPLSERELDVLRLLGTDLSGPEIARELVVSVNTVRTHTKNIYAKLGVTSRRAAVRRGGELDLLSRKA